MLNRRKRIVVEDAGYAAELPLAGTVAVADDVAVGL